jgi:hypothetical protein
MKRGDRRHPAMTKETCSRGARPATAMLPHRLALALTMIGALAGCPFDDDDEGVQTWTLAIEGGGPIGPGLPPEIVTVGIAPGVTSSVFETIRGQWYVLDRLDNVVELQFTETFVSNRWRFTGTGGPSPDGMTVQLAGDGDADAGYPDFTEVHGTMTLNFMLPGGEPVSQTARWDGVRE